MVALQFPPSPHFNMDFNTFSKIFDNAAQEDRLKLALDYMSAQLDAAEKKTQDVEKKRQDEWEAAKKKRQEIWDAAEKKRQDEWAAEKEEQRVASSTYSNLMNLKQEMDSKTIHRKLQKIVVRH